MEGKQHASVVAAIKEGGDETKLLVVDVLTDEFFKKCKVVPSEAHLEGGSGASAAGSPRPQALGGSPRALGGGILFRAAPLCQLRAQIKASCEARGCGACGEEGLWPCRLLFDRFYG